MNPFSLILNGGIFFLIAGVFLSSYSLLTGLVVMTVRIWNRLFVSWARRRLRDLGLCGSMIQWQNPFWMVAVRHFF